MPQHDLRLDLLSDSPRNGEGRFPELRSPVTPTEAFYIRSNFPTPELDAESFRLDVADLDGGMTSYGLDALADVADIETRTVTLECAGNGRTLMSPQPNGTPWNLGATGTAKFRGVPLVSVLPDLSDAVEILFTGGDRGEKEGWGEIAFQRSLPVEALSQSPSPLLAWEMNGEPLSADHGGPLRLVVPGWYAVASVKWVTRIDLLREPFAGYFQADRYMYVAPGGDGSAAPEPVTRMRVRSLVLAVGDRPIQGNGTAHTPDTGAVLPLTPGRHTISGMAWTGYGEVKGVQVSTDGGERWSDATVDTPGEPFTRTGWSFEWDAEPGDYQIVARATDSSGQVQPLEQYWNALGYGNNTVHRVAVRVS